MLFRSKFDGLSSEAGKSAILEELKKNNQGEFKINFRLRDWLVSRQRYWGAPIPVVYCEEHGEVIVPESQLPVELPYDVNFTPDGTSPLAKHEGFMNTKCPICNKPARRDPDTLDTFVCSSWYFLRYPDSKNTKKAFDSEKINKMLPVDKYIGGAEHACMHLLYARFFTKALRDMGYLNFDEPFTSLVHQGTILGTDGNKMSKSKGNVVSPDDYICQHGSDVFRLYLGFGFKYIEGGPWSEDGIKSIVKWAERVERTVLKTGGKAHKNFGAAEKELNFIYNNTAKSVAADYETFSFNTAIARMMELVNALTKYDNENEAKNTEFYKEVCKNLVIMLAPLAPHIAEELWEKLGCKYSVFNQRFPVADEKALVRDELELAVQINSKIRSKIVVSASATESEVIAAVKADERITELLEGKPPKKFIVIAGRLVNIIV